jgi:hypothetical protein
MQPLLLIDWLRQLRMTADSALATKRWNLAEALAKNASRTDVIVFLRVFLFPSVAEQYATELTTRFLKIDNEFTGSNNLDEVRLVAGLTMIASKGDAHRQQVAEAFGLGLRAAVFPSHRCNPVQKAIVEEMRDYLENRSNELRPNNFERLLEDESLADLVATVTGEPTANVTTQNGSSHRALANYVKSNYVAPLQRIAEESAVLWWMVGKYSSSLDKRTSELHSDDYALIAASEVAERMQISPPPPSIAAVIHCALSSCKAARKRKATLFTIVAAADKTWRGKFLSSRTTNDTADLVPICAALSKIEDHPDMPAFSKALAKACPNVASDLDLTPPAASLQLFNEIVFLKALAKIN